MTPLQLENINKEDFEKWTGESFQVAGPGEEVILFALTEVNSLGTASEGMREPFSLIFKVALEQPLEQSIYSLQNDQVGQLDLFLVPIGPAAESGFLYEAVIT